MLLKTKCVGCLRSVKASREAESAGRLMGGILCLYVVYHKGIMTRLVFEVKAKASASKRSQ